MGVGEVEAVELAVVVLLVRAVPLVVGVGVAELGGVAAGERPPLAVLLPRRHRAVDVVASVRMGEPRIVADLARDVGVELSEVMVERAVLLHQDDDLVDAPGGDLRARQRLARLVTALERAGGARRDGLVVGLPLVLAGGGAAGDGGSGEGQEEQSGEAHESQVEQCVRQPYVRLPRADP